MRASILGITSYLPAQSVTNADLNARFPEWSVDRTADKTGIHRRHIASNDQSASDLAYAAAQQLFTRRICTPDEVDYLLFCTQSPDYFLPTTACLLQQRLGIPKRAGALDFNLGCSGYVYGLGLAQGLIVSGQASRVLFLTAETYSKYLDPQDRSSITIFGDGAAATLIGAVPDREAPMQSAYVYGTDGTGAEHLMVSNGGSRARCANQQPAQAALWMNGPEIFHFTLRVVPACDRELLEKTDKRIEDIDLFVFHQANRYMLEHLRTKLQIPTGKFYISLAETGNTVSSTIPIALESARDEGRLKPGQQIMLVGFGVGLSWGATLLSWPYLG
ncbi:MAG: ketoacyl-ACP synthase III [Acidobacteriota bacterium]|nr:ketoacyl-ACP synthase III [Acidobacteriota bacterium]